MMPLHEECEKGLFESEIGNEGDVYYLANVCRSIAEQLGFVTFECGLISTAVSEIAMNVVRHAEQGYSAIKLTENEKGIEINIDDIGPGIENLDVAMQDGFSTYGSMGMGLGASKRSVDEFIVHKHDVTGTSITLRKYLPVPKAFVDVGAIFSSSAFQSSANQCQCFKYGGDKALIVYFEHPSFHQENQLIEAGLLKQLLRQHYQLSLQQLTKKCLASLVKNTKSKDIKAALFRLTPDSIEYLIQGKVGIYGVPQRRFGFPPRQLHETLNRPESFCVILHSEMVSYSNMSLPRQNTYSSQTIAMTIFDEFVNQHKTFSVVTIQG